MSLTRLRMLRALSAWTMVAQIALLVLMAAHHHLPHSDPSTPPGWSDAAPGAPGGDMARPVTGCRLCASSVVSLPDPQGSISPFVPALGGPGARHDIAPPRRLEGSRTHLRGPPAA